MVLDSSVWIRHAEVRQVARGASADPREIESVWFVRPFGDDSCSSQRFEMFGVSAFLLRSEVDALLSDDVPPGFRVQVAT